MKFTTSSVTLRDALTTVGGAVPSKSTLPILECILFEHDADTSELRLSTSLAHATLHKREVNLVLAKEVLRDMIKDTRVNLTIEEIQRIVCEYIAKQLTQHSLKTIGLHFGGRDHSTVIHANQSVENQIETNPKFREMIEEIRHKIDLRSR